MSKLEELIEELCPDGVEMITVGELIKSKKIKTITPSIKIKRNDYKELGSIPIISQEAEFISGYCEENDTNIPDGCYVCFGDHSEHIKYIDFSFVQGADGLKIMTTKADVVSARYFYHATSNYYMRHNNYERHFKYFQDTFIPIPPLPVQEEIVRILDNFTDLTAELQAELQARAKQYEYYMTKLLIFENVPYYALEDVCEIVDYRGKTPKKVSEGIFLITAKNIRKGYIDYDKSQEFISPDDYEEVMRRGMPKIGDVLITTEAPCGNIAQIDREDIALAQRVIKYRPNEKMLDNTFLKYILLGKEFQDKLMKNATGGTVKGIKGSKLHKLTIPVPSLEVQRNVVDCLSEFEKLSNSISDGLPAEIEARKKQYEYYRNKLLTFKELGA